MTDANYRLQKPAGAISLMVDDKRICAECVKERSLSAQISRSAEDEEACDYCKRVAPTFSLSEVADVCDHVIETYFMLASEHPSVKLYGRNPDGQSLVEILDMWLTADDQSASEDVAEILRDRWLYDGDGRYGEDPWFVRHGSSWELARDWRDMERSLRGQARLVNPKVAADARENLRITS